VTITLEGTKLVLRGQLSRLQLDAVRALPERRFDGQQGCWVIPHTRENLPGLRLVPGLDLAALPEPTDSSFRVHAKDGMLYVTTPYTPRNVEICRGIPDHHKWEGAVKAWKCKPTGRTLEYLKAQFPNASWSVAARELYERVVAAEQERVAMLRAEKERILADVAATVDDYVFGGPYPFAHQRQAFLLSRLRTAFALLMEQGTGKTKVLIDTACWLFLRGLIQQVLVVAPNSVKTNWVTDEVPLHTPAHVAYRAAYWGGGSKEHQRQIQSLLDDESAALRWFSVNIEALSTGGAAERAAEAFLRKAPTMMIVDESSRIKAPGAQRSRAVMRLSKLAPYRRIATGTPITQGPLDAFQQFQFLDPNILGFGSFTAFKRHFAQFGGYNDRVIVGYSHLDELQDRIKPHSFRVLRDECLDLPPKIYQRQEVELAPEQRKIYDQMRDELRAELAGAGQVTVTMVLTQLLRLQQITGGFIPLEVVEVAENGIPVVSATRVEPIPGPNPKLNALIDVARDVTGKIIIWARFRPEIKIIAEQLREEFGPDTVVEFHGGVNDEGRIHARTAFQDATSTVRFFVGQTETGGLGLTLTQAKTVIYFSNSFSYESRIQSEDRAHRIGQTQSVTYVDLVARDTRDDFILASVRGKRSLANAITGDRWKEWI
jgi:hypothetical protein